MAKSVKNNDSLKLAPNAAKEKTSLYILVDLLEELKYIEYKDDRTRTDIFNDAIADYVIAWKKKNGPIPKKV